MLKKADITWENHRFQLTGALDFSNVMSVYYKSLPLAEQCSELIFDFAQVGPCNSAVLALMIEWIKLARRLHKPIQFLHLPQTALALAKAAGLADITIAV